MKHLILFLIGIFCLQTLTAQEFDVREFKANSNDLAARRNEKRTVNDEPCALVKITTNIKGMQFDSNIGIVAVVHQDDGYWVYVAPRERRIKLMAEGYISFDMDMPEPAKSHMVYSVVVAPKGLFFKSDLVGVTFRMNQSQVYIRSGKSAPVLSTGNNAVFNVAKGDHSYVFVKEGFSEKELKFNVTSDTIIDISLTPGKKTTRLALSGWIIISSEPSGAEVFLNEQRVGVTPYQGSNIAGRYNLRLQYPLYHDHIEQFDLPEGVTNTLPLVNMKPRFGYWLVTSSPSGAEVILDGKLVGTTPLTRGQVSSGYHELTMRKPLYYDHKENFTIDDGDDKRFNITLSEAFGELAITSDPSAAKVFVDEREVGVTPYHNPQQPSGNYNVRLTKELFSDARENIVVSDGRKTERFVVLSQNYGTLNIVGENSDIYVNGKKVGSNTYSANLTSGQYKLKATREKHEDDQRDVFLVLGQTENVTLTPSPRMGALSIISKPFETTNAEIFINTKKQQQTTPAVIPMLMGSYNVTVKKSGYLDASQSVVVKESQEQKLEFNLQTYKGSMLQTANRYKKQKLVYGSATIAAAGTGTFFLLSANKLNEDYKTATTNATEIYDKMERYDLYSYISYGIAVPLGVMTVIKYSQQKRTEKKVKMAVLPYKNGLLFGLAYQF